MVSSPQEARRLLGVGPAADADDVRRAYRRLARERHPDTGGDAASFQELQQAVRLLLDDRPMPRLAASPSTSNMSRPSTDGPLGSAAWGESARPRWHDGAVDVAGVDWTTPLPSPPHGWTRERLAVRAATPMDATIVHPAEGVSRRPGSRLNRVAHWLSADLMARFRIHPSPERGVVGHDVEIRLDFPPGRGRKLADGARLPRGWTRQRRPDSTVLWLLMPPSRDRRATAVRAVDHLSEALEALGWPLDDWYRVPG